MQHLVAIFEGHEFVRIYQSQSREVALGYQLGFDDGSEGMDGTEAFLLPVDADLREAMVEQYGLDEVAAMDAATIEYSK